MSGYLNGELVYRVNSRYQLIEVVDTPAYDRILLLDGVPQTSSRYSAYIHEASFLIPFYAHGSVRKALILGGGDLFGAVELLRAGVQHVEVVELDQEVIRTSANYLLQPGDKPWLETSNLVVHTADARTWIETATREYDLIVMDLTDPVSGAESLFGRHFLRRVKARLAPHGIVASHAESPEVVSSGCSPDAFYRIHATFKSVFESVAPYRVWTPPYREMFCRLIAGGLGFAREGDPPIQKHTWLNRGLYRAVFDYWSNDIQAEMARDWPPYE